MKYVLIKEKHISTKSISEEKESGSYGSSKMMFVFASPKKAVGRLEEKGSILFKLGLAKIPGRGSRLLN